MKTQLAESRLNQEVLKDSLENMHFQLSKEKHKYQQAVEASASKVAHLEGVVHKMHQHTKHIEEKVVKAVIFRLLKLRRKMES